MMPTNDSFINAEFLEGLLKDSLEHLSFESSTLTKEECLALFTDKVVTVGDQLNAQGMLPQMIEATWMATAGSLMVQNFLLRVQLLVQQGHTPTEATHLVLGAEV